MTTPTPTWSITALDCKVKEGTLSDVVITSHYTCSAYDGTYYGSVYSTIQLGAPDPSNYTPFDQITEVQAIQWTKDALGAEAVTAAEAAVLQQIELQKHPVVVTPPLPWNNQPSTH